MKYLPKYMPVLILILLIGYSIPNYGQNKEELIEKWNLREKNRVLEHLKTRTRYKGVFHHKYQEIVHEINFAGDSVEYLKIKTASVITLCSFPAADAEITLQKIFATYHNDNKDCNDLYDSGIFLDTQPIGQAEGTPLVMVRTFAPSENQDARYIHKIHELNEFGTGEFYDTTTYTDKLHPLRIYNQTRIMIDRAAGEIYAEYNGNRVDLPDDLTSMMLKAAKSTRNLNVFDINGRMLYTNAGDMQNSALVAFDLKKQEAEMLASAAVGANIIDQHIYFLTEKGIERMRLNGKRRELIFSGEFMNFLETIDIHPIEEGSKYLVTGPSGFRIINYEAFENFEGTGENLFRIAKLSDELQQKLSEDSFEQFWQQNVESYFLPEVSTALSNGYYYSVPVGEEIWLASNNPFWPVFNIGDALLATPRDENAGEAETAEEVVAEPEGGEY